MVTNAKKKLTNAEKRARKKEREARFSASATLVKEQMPEDVPDGYSSDGGSDKNQSAWVKRQSRYAKSLNQNAYAYFNYHAHRNTGIIETRRKQRKPQRIISAVKFPPYCTVSYAYPPMFAFKSINVARKVKHVVVHSMGHSWHAGTGKKTKGGWVEKTKSGWMNSGRGKRGLAQLFAPPFLKGFQPFVFIPKGTTNEKTMEHYRRFATGMSYLLRTSAGSTAHFMIDRAGNLIVNGDVNDIMYTSNGLNSSSVGVEMEEAFYSEATTIADGKSSTWRSGTRTRGGPVATAGTVEYWPFSPRQMRTLAVLCRKLEIMYPSLHARKVGFKHGARTPASPGGYTMHHWVKGGNHPDASPHFITQAKWNVLFKLIDKETDIGKHDCFKSATYSGDAAVNISQVEPLAAEPLTATTERVYNEAKETGIARDRANNLANVSKGGISSRAGKGATLASSQVSQQVATSISTAQQAQEPIIELPQSDSQLGADGFTAGHDDMWEYP